MRLFTEKHFRSLFRIGIAVKAIDSVVEIVAGLFLYFVSPGFLSAAGHAIIGNELSEDPHDLVWNYIATGFRHLTPDRRGFLAVLLLAHGALKLSFIIGLLKHKAWSYPLAIGGFTLFILYQIENILQTPSAFLEVLTCFDILVVWLIVHEYRVENRRKKADRM